jgi:hypothetical protein
MISKHLIQATQLSEIKRLTMLTKCQWSAMPISLDPMADSDFVDDPQNPLHRRLFIIRPRPEYFATTGLPPDHPSSEVVAILTPRLPFETWYEGWQLSWRTKAKQDFIADFAELWATAFPFETVQEVPTEFLAQLTTDSPAESVFDRWWFIEEHRDLREMDETWRPS